MTAELQERIKDWLLYRPIMPIIGRLPPCYSPPMQVTLTPHGEELLQAALARGLGNSPEEVIERPLETVAEQATPTAERQTTAAQAVAHIRESRKGVALGGLKIKDMIHEAHKY